MTKMIKVVVIGFYGIVSYEFFKPILKFVQEKELVKNKTTGIIVASILSIFWPIMILGMLFGYFFLFLASAYDYFISEGDSEFQQE